jgi:hypothetical protein
LDEQPRRKREGKGGGKLEGTGRRRDDIIGKTPSRSVFGNAAVHSYA